MIAFNELMRLRKDVVYDVKLFDEAQRFGLRVKNPGVTCRITFDQLVISLTTGSPLRMQMENPVSATMWGESAFGPEVPDHIYIPNHASDGVRLGLEWWMIESILEVS